MFLAHTRKLDLDGQTPASDVTFTCQDHDPGALISLITRYQRLTNELNDTNVQYMLLTISDASQSIGIELLSALGPIILSSEKINALRSEVVQKRGGYNIKLSPTDLTKGMSDEQIGIMDLQIFGLPSADTHPDDPVMQGVAPIVKGFIYSGKLWRESKDSKQVWVIKTGEDSYQHMAGPGYYVIRNGVASLEEKKPV